MDKIRSYVIVFKNNLLHLKDKYKLEKDTPKYIVKSPGDIPKTSSELKNISKVIEQYVKAFVKIIPENKLALFYQNLESLKVEDHPEFSEIIFNIIAIVLGNGISEGYYNGPEHKIHLVSEKESKLLMFFSRSEKLSYEKFLDNTIPHELFHIATYLLKDEVIYYGFYQVSSEHEIGEAINEGYTELLARRYFKKGKDSYDFEVLIATFIEKIIGKQEMEEMYFNLDLKSLISTLAAYSSEQDAYEFIENLDYFFAKAKRTTLNDIVLFLVNTYKQKVIKRSDIDNATKEKIIGNYNEELINSINNYFSFNREKKHQHKR